MWLTLPYKPFSVCETREFSIPLLRLQIETQILAEIIWIPTGSANLSSFRVGASLRVDNQSLCEAKLMPTGSATPLSRPPLLLPELCRLLLRRTPCAPNQCWIVRGQYIFSLQIMDAQNLHFYSGFYSLDITSPALDTRDWQATRSFCELNGRLQLFL